MPVFRNRARSKITESAKVLLNKTLARGAPPRTLEEIEQIRQQLELREKELEDLRRRLDGERRENARLRSSLVAHDGSGKAGLIAPERIVWSFGSGRSGSSWLNAMLREPENHVNWGEPLVGKLFADLYYGPQGQASRENRHFILSEPLKDVWLRSIRSFVLDGATARFPEVVERGYLMVTDPNGSVGAPLIMGALPESRLIFLVRDPRDVVASFLDANRSGSWLHSWRGGKDTMADSQPDVFVKQRAKYCAEHMGRAKEAYDAHEGPKIIVRYEDLCADTVGLMRRIYDDLGIPVDDGELLRSVEMHAWENLPEADKGQGRFFRKGTPGGWREDLTAKQAGIVEEITAPLLKEFYSG